MKIRYVHGDLLRSGERYILQGCNAQGVMGSGVAKLLRDQDERVYTEYREVYERQGNKLFLGQTIWVQREHDTVINGITQEFFGRVPNTTYVSYDAVGEVIRSIDLRAVTFPAMEIKTVGMPLIGAGLAQGKWSIISEIIEANAVHFEPVVYLLDGKIPE